MDEDPTKTPPGTLSARARPSKALLHDAVDATTWLVGEGHDSTARLVVGALSSVPSLEEPTKAVDGLRHKLTHGVLGTVRAVNRGVEKITDVALDLSPIEEEPEPELAMRSDTLISVPGAVDQIVGALNGAVGDHLSDSDNGLDLGMKLRHERPLGPRLVVLVHGLATTELSWSFEAETGLGSPDAHYGGLLQQDLGLCPVYVRYNTGRPIADNGRALAERLEQLVNSAAQPVEELVLIGHSMGGLVSRAASTAAKEQGHRWLDLLSHLICLGSPHAGAPLARLGHQAAHVLQAIEFPATRILGRILDRRSEGVKDLRHEEHRAAGPLLDQVDYLFVAGSVTPDPEHPAADWLGDLLVPVSSASGPSTARHTTVRRFGSVPHHQLQVHAGVYKAIRDYLSA